jgi:hypothetical protein
LVGSAMVSVGGEPLIETIFDPLDQLDSEVANGRDGRDKTHGRITIDILDSPHTDT